MLEVHLGFVVSEVNYFFFDEVIEFVAGVDEIAFDRT